MNVKEVLGAFLLVNNPIVLSEEETKDVQKAIKQLQQENKILKENTEHNDKVVDKVNWENMLLKKENEKLKKVIDMASARLEYFLIGNLKYQSSQEEFIKLVNILKEVSK